MARKPIELEMAGMLTPRERVWQAIRQLRTFTPAQLLGTIRPRVKIGAITSYLQCLCQAGYLKETDEPGYQLVKDSFAAPRVTRDGAAVTQGIGTLAMWRAMIALKEFDWHDIQRAASLPGSEVSALAAKHYVSTLARAGYFRTMRASQPGRAARFRLVKNTGPHAPAITRRKAVFDRNTADFTWQEPEQEVCDGLE